ncbi:MAG: DUF3566 domain-containing protein, partial [Jatrophihabitantaceae bacterium]
MTQAHGGPSFGQALSSGGDFGATTVSGQTRPKVDEAGPTSTVPTVTDPSNAFTPRGAGPAAGTHAAPFAPPASAPSAPGKPSIRARARGPRRARLQLRHINPWTVFKFACALSIALFFIWLLTVAALYGILDATGVIGR